MSSAPRPADHPALAPPRIGVLLVNLGTPAAPTAAAVRRYLAEFLSDRRVIEIPPILWQPLLRGVILNLRPRRSAHGYAQIWEEGGSPLAVITAAQARALAARLGTAAQVRWAMRYGQPSLAAELDCLRAEGCTRILVAPLYPQYCAATSASVTDALGGALAAMRWQPAIRTLPPYYDDPAYISALHADLGRQLAALDFTPELLVLSFHGMPQRTLALGDPYHCHCQKTARLLGARFAQSHPRLKLVTSFQSRFGRAKWLEPATGATIAAAARDGIRRLAIAAPGFAADCLETREELGIRGRAQFLAAGGEAFAALDCLNAGDAGMAMIEALVRRELSGWLS